MLHQAQHFQIGHRFDWQCCRRVLRRSRHHLCFHRKERNPKPELQTQRVHLQEACSRQMRRNSMLQTHYRTETWSPPRACCQRDWKVVADQKVHRPMKEALNQINSSFFELVGLEHPVFWHSLTFGQAQVWELPLFELGAQAPKPCLSL